MVLKSCHYHLYRHKNYPMIRKRLINVGCHNSRDKTGPGGAMLPLVLTCLLPFRLRQKSGNLVFWVAEQET